ncbi:VOC family protein [Microbacterium sp.]|uniref:VOC family protein n=1 Tax=Microbacterium sp. TaxID=51671 RepID=UPI0028111926|nr:VOC family protein [Microbacterium sp.]
MDWDRVYQVGIVVADIGRAAAHYALAGIGPFEAGPSENVTARRVHGAPSDAVVRGACAQMGPIELELLQPVSGASVQAEALAERGEHTLHICAYTDDLDADIAEMAEAGFPVISEGTLADGGRFAYFDTRAIGGLVLERHQLPR